MHISTFNWILQVTISLLLALSKGTAGDLGDNFDEDYDDIDEDYIDEAHQPNLTSTAISVKAAVGESVTFPCDVDDLGDFPLLWKRGNNMLLFVGDLRITRDLRIRTDGTSLHITNVQPTDSGEYVCQITTLKPNELRHTLEVLYPPTVRANPEEAFITAKEGENIRLMCEATGNPVPNITWRHAGRRHESFEGNSYVINNAQRNDSGEYECIADNSIGEPASAVITVEIVSAPKVYPEPSNGLLVVKEGEPITIGCKATGDPTPVITWKKPNGERMMKMNYENEIVIAEASPKDAGDYECIANNSLGISTSTKIRVLVLFAPKVRMSHSRIHAREGDVVNITCVAEGEPSPTVVWKKDDDQVIHSTDRYHLKVHGHSHMLIIDHIQEQDFGKYECFASNSLSRAIGTTHLIGTPQVPSFSSKPHSTQGTKYTISLKVNTHTPVDEYSLMYRKKGDNEEWETKSVPATQNDDEMHTQMFQLNELQPSTEYEAVVKARNKFGWSEESEALVFTTKNEDPPTVRANPEEAFITAKEGESIRLMCDATGNPVPTITWRHAGRRLESFKANSYVINNAQKNDSGEYECIADNSIGEPASAVITIEIVSAPKVYPEPSNGLLVVKEGEPITIGCKATGDPTPFITWKKPNGERMMKMNDESKIIIAEASQKDAGHYECIANNSLGISTSTKIRVQVLFAPKVRMSYSRIDAREGDVVNITGVAEGEPSPTVTWKKDDRQIINSTDRDREKIMQAKKGDNEEGETKSVPATHVNDDEMHTQLNELQPSTEYEAVVKARNKFGWSEESEALVFTTKNEDLYRFFPFYRKAYGGLFK